MQTQTTPQLLAYYSNLLLAEYKSQPRAVQTIQTLAALALMPEGGNVVTDPATGDPLFQDGQLVVDGPYGTLLPLALQAAFNLPTAQGQQLQFLAEATGAKNAGYNLSGQWTVLSDADFSKLIQAVVARNFLVATNSNIDAFMAEFFSGVMTSYDQLNMAMSFQFLKPLGTTLWAELFITQGFLPNPVCVSPSIDFLVGLTGPFFGFIGELEASPANPQTAGFGSELGAEVGTWVGEANSILVPGLN